jgi:hydroxypyruvate isomerase
MKRREFLRAGAAVVGGVWTHQAAAAHRHVAFDRKPPFRLKYAPHFGMFKHLAGDDLIDQLEFAAEHGFRAWEDTGLKNRPVKVQDQIARAMQDGELEMGALVAVESYQDVTFAGKSRRGWARVLDELRQSIEVAERVGTKWLTVVPGPCDRRLPLAAQTDNCIELLHRCCDLVEPAGLVMVLEPIRGPSGHGGCLLQSVEQAYRLCRTVGRSGCKILLDFYHQHLSTDEMIGLIDATWPEIAYVQCGDRPGRREPGTGHIDYRRIFQHLFRVGYDGIVGMEHGNSLPGIRGERAVIGAYAAVDPW